LERRRQTLKGSARRPSATQSLAATLDDEPFVEGIQLFTPIAPTVH
jgi:hypothetical protein